VHTSSWLRNGAAQEQRRILRKWSFVNALREQLVPSTRLEDNWHSDLESLFCRGQRVTMPVVEDKG